LVWIFRSAKLSTCYQRVLWWLSEHGLDDFIWHDKMDYKLVLVLVLIAMLTGSVEGHKTCWVIKKPKKYKPGTN